MVGEGSLSSLKPMALVLQQPNTVGYSLGVSSCGPLRDVRVVDVSALAPGPFCSMILADFGADVIAVEPVHPPQFDVASFFSRGKRSIRVDLRHPDGVAAVARLAASADVFVEGYRPGTMERLGLGPDDLRHINPGLI